MNDAKKIPQNSSVVQANKSNASERIPELQIRTHQARERREREREKSGKPETLLSS